MTNPNEMTDEQRIEEASRDHTFSVDFLASSYEHGFVSGAKWRDANPSPKVQELVRALEEINDILKVGRYIPSDKAQYFKQALANFRKEG